MTPVKTTYDSLKKYTKVSNFATSISASHLFLFFPTTLIADLGGETSTNGDFFNSITDLFTHKKLYKNNLSQGHNTQTNK